MHRKLLVMATIMAIMLVGAPYAQAITFGQPDGTLHPNVGTMIVEFPNGNTYLWCSGSLIAPDVFLTAAHCTNSLVGYGVAPDKVWVTFDPVADENATLLHGIYVVNPGYGHDMHDLHDVAVVLLDTPVADLPMFELTPRQLALDLPM